MSTRSPAGIEAVVFDLFHTLVDPEDFRPRDFDRLREVAGVLGVPEAPWRAFWETALTELVARPDSPAERAAAWARGQGAAVAPGQVQAVDDILGRYQDLAICHPRPEVLAALEDLRRRGLRLGLLSNAHERDVRAWERSPLRPLIAAAGISCRIGCAKPDPAAYRWVLARLGVDASQAAFVGDGGGGELAGARTAGFGLVVLVSGPALRSGLRRPEEIAALAAEADRHLAGVEDLGTLLGEDLA